MRLSSRGLLNHVFFATSCFLGLFLRAHGLCCNYTEYSMDIASTTRNWMAMVPSTYEAGNPIVIELHDDDDNMCDFSSKSGMREQAIAHGFVHVVPQGLAALTADQPETSRRLDEADEGEEEKEEEEEQQLPEEEREVEPELEVQTEDEEVPAYVEAAEKALGEVLQEEKTGENEEEKVSEVEDEMDEDEEAEETRRMELANQIAKTESKETISVDLASTRRRRSRRRRDRRRRSRRRRDRRRRSRRRSQRRRRTRRRRDRRRRSRRRREGRRRECKVHASSNGQWMPTTTSFNNNDMVFLRSIVEEAVVTFGIDTSRVYFVGHGGGCQVAQMMAYLASDIVAAVACSSSYFFDMSGLPQFSYTPIPVMEIHGVIDETIGFYANSYRSWVHGGALANLEYWKDTNGCEGDVVTTTYNTFDRHTYSLCNNSAEVSLVQLHGVGHLPYWDFESVVDTSQLVWDFVKRFAKKSTYLEGPCGEGYTYSHAGEWASGVPEDATNARQCWGACEESGSCVAYSFNLYEDSCTLYETQVVEALETEDGDIACMRWDELSGARGTCSGGEAVFDSSWGSLEQCKAKCLEIEECAYVLYGYFNSDAQWCKIYSNASRCGGTGGSQEGVVAHKLWNGFVPPTSSPWYEVGTAPNAPTQRSYALLGQGCFPTGKMLFHSANRTLPAWLFWTAYDKGTPTSLEVCSDMCASTDGCLYFTHGYSYHNPLCILYSHAQLLVTTDSLSTEPLVCDSQGISTLNFYEMDVTGLANEDGHVWKDLGPGCCSDTDLIVFNTSDVGSLDECQGNCENDATCGHIVYGWVGPSFDNQCIGFGVQANCSSELSSALRKSATGFGPGCTSTGVRTYRLLDATRK
mmetsp:Transcript_85874/g.179462  ORF Transcript_85874/g.179462 Transcript_85874/m.179462 type:complete len:862 (+) Transcript_85874:383-2968(+)